MATKWMDDEIVTRGTKHIIIYRFQTGLESSVLLIVLLCL